MTHKHRKRWIWWTLPVALVVAIALVLHFGSTSSWREADCTVTGSRVVRADVADSFRATVLYKGEYHVRYSVGGHDYYQWANSGWADPDREFVQAKIDSLPETCDFQVRYNPLHPSEAVVLHK